MKNFFSLIFFIAYAQAVDPELIRCHDAVILFKQAKYESAYKISKQKQCKKLEIISRWYQLRQNTGNLKFSDYVNFIFNNPNLPHIHKIKITAEKYLDTANRKQIINWFKNYKPNTYTGINQYLKILSQLNQQQQLIKTIRYGWRTIKFTPGEEYSFWKQYKQHIHTQDTIEKINHIIKIKKYEDAIRNIHNFLPISKRRYLLAKLHLCKGSSSAKRIYTSLPNIQKKNIELFKAYITFLQKKENTSQVEDILSNKHESLSHHSNDLWRIRYIAARDLLITKNYNRAYKILKNHNVNDTTSLVRCEWLLGFISSRFTKKNSLALTHFYKAYKHSKTISIKAQLEYWIARTHKNMNNNTMYHNWLLKASSKPSTFYGQIALKLLGKPINIKFQPIKYNTYHKKFILNDDRMRLALLLKNIGEEVELIPILKKISKTYQTSAQKNTFLALVKQYFPDQACYVSIEMGKSHLHRAGYPHIKYKLKKLKNYKLTHAVIRHESGFNSFAVGATNDYGLMQLLPETAKRVAKILNIPVTKKDLTTKPKLNITLGNAYINGLLDRYQNNQPLALSAYNAGEGNADKWINRYGDPRKKSVDTVTWIELIPYTGTRMYVKKVIANYNIYRNI